MDNCRSVTSWAVTALLLCSPTLPAAQPALPFDLKQLSIGLPEAGAPRAVVGPYAVTAEKPATNPALQLYRPADLAKFPASDTLPIVVWGNGACLADGTDFAGYLSTIASYGFLVVGTAPVPGNPQARLTSADLIKALDWAQAQNARKDSPLVGKLRTDAVAVMGMSCGGNLALEAARDPRVKTLGMWNSGVWISGEMRTGDGTLLVGTTKKDLAFIHSPTLYINGDKIDPAMVNAATTLPNSTRCPCSSARATGPGIPEPTRTPMAVSSPTSQCHGCAGSSRQTRHSGRVFTGADCTLCKDANWTVQRKGM